MQRKVSVVAAALMTKGMEPANNHHTMYKKQVEGVTTVVTRISHGADTIGDTLALLMGKQCYLRLREFWDLVDCPLSEEAWEDLVRARCVGGRNPFLGQ